MMVSLLIVLNDFFLPTSLVQKISHKYKHNSHFQNLPLSLGWEEHQYVLCLLVSAHHAIFNSLLPTSFLPQRLPQISVGTGSVWVYWWVPLHIMHGKYMHSAQILGLFYCLLISWCLFCEDVHLPLSFIVFWFYLQRNWWWWLLKGNWFPCNRE